MFLLVKRWQVRAVVWLRANQVRYPNVLLSQRNDGSAQVGSKEGRQLEATSSDGYLTPPRPFFASRTIYKRLWTQPKILIRAASTMRDELILVRWRCGGVPRNCHQFLVGAATRSEFASRLHGGFLPSSPHGARMCIKLSSRNASVWEITLGRRSPSRTDLGLALYLVRRTRFIPLSFIQLHGWASHYSLDETPHL